MAFEYESAKNRRDFFETRGILDLGPMGFQAMSHKKIA
jgi:hypothetical protein